METELEIIDLTFSFDRLEILSVVDNNVHLKTHEEQSDKPCILSIDRERFVKATNDWLDDKADYYNRWKHYCGVGYIIVYDCAIIGKTNLNVYDEVAHFYDLEVNIYSPQSHSEIIVDMEHG